MEVTLKNAASAKMAPATQMNNFNATQKPPLVKPMFKQRLKSNIQRPIKK